MKNTKIKKRLNKAKNAVAKAFKEVAHLTNEPKLKNVKEDLCEIFEDLLWACENLSEIKKHLNDLIKA